MGRESEWVSESDSESDISKSDPKVGQRIPIQADAKDTQDALAFCCQESRRPSSSFAAGIESKRDERIAASAAEVRGRKEQKRVTAAAAAAVDEACPVTPGDHQSKRRSRKSAADVEAATTAAAAGEKERDARATEADVVRERANVAEGRTRLFAPSINARRHDPRLRTRDSRPHDGRQTD